MSPEQRLVVRQIDSALLVSDLRNWFETVRLPGRGPTAEAISYALTHWEGLARQPWADLPKVGDDVPAPCTASRYSMKRANRFSGGAY